ncbi:MAG: hypothetical protein EXR62_07140, partial [Chloroflexi bacterium]|nr:hypothetical protein [Chloroflexota bacterium]
MSCSGVYTAKLVKKGNCLEGVAAMHRQLDAQADRIEAVLAAHKVTARVQGGVVTPRLVRFRLQAAVGTRLQKVQTLSEELACALGAPDCRVVRRGAFLDVEITRPRSADVSLIPLLARVTHLPPVTAL